MDDALNRLERYVERVILSPEDRASMLNYLMSTTHMPLVVAAEMTGLPAKLLRKLVRCGVLRGEAPYRVKEIAGWCDIEQALEIARRIHEAREPVEGRGISVLEAEQKYRFPRATIYQWIEKGKIKPLNVTENRMALNEADIAFARAIADIIGRKQGKSILP